MKAAQARLGPDEWWRRVMAINRHNYDQDNALIRRWPVGTFETLPTYDEYHDAVEALRDEMGIPRVHGYPDPAKLPPIIYSEQTSNDRAKAR